MSSWYGNKKVPNVAAFAAVKHFKRVPAEPISAMRLRKASRTGFSYSANKCFDGNAVAIIVPMDEKVGIDVIKKSLQQSVDRARQFASPVTHETKMILYNKHTDMKETKNVVIVTMNSQKKIIVDRAALTTIRLPKNPVSEISVQPTYAFAWR